MKRFLSSIKAVFTPSIQTLLSRDLNSARCTYETHLAALEYYKVTVPMLKKKIKRLEIELDIIIQK
jgi:hypothetical protein